MEVSFEEGIEVGELAEEHLDSDDENEESNGEVKEKMTVESELDLLAAIEEAKTAMYLFLNNKEKEAEDLLKVKCKTSMYHALSNGVMHWALAVLSMDTSLISVAMDVLREATSLCNSRRKRDTLTHNVVTKLIFRPDYNEYTEEEVHAELCYAECILLRTLLAFLKETGIISLVRGGFKIRKAHQIYKECQDILVYRNWSNAALKENFESGVDLGLGTFNLGVSAVPKVLLKLLEFVGFTGERDVGLSRLFAGQKRFDAPRSVFCALFLIAYNVVIQLVITNPKINECVSVAEELLQPLATTCPEGVIIKHCQARIEYMKGNIHAAIEQLEAVYSRKIGDVNLHHIGAWQLSLYYMSVGEPRKSLHYMNVLYTESNWSKCTFAFMKGSIMLMCDDITEDERKEIESLMRETPSHLRQIVGRFIPMENFLCNRAKRFLAQDNWLLLPYFEVMYNFNCLYVLRGQEKLLQQLMAVVQKASKELESERRKASPWHVDNCCLATFQKGLLLSYMGKSQRAEKCFFEVIEQKDNIKDDVHIISFALMELGFMYQNEGKYEQAVHFLTAARSSSVFITEFRIHNAFEEIKRSGYYDGVMDQEVQNDVWRS